MTDWPVRLKAWSEACDATLVLPKLDNSADVRFIALARTALPEAIARIRFLDSLLRAARTEIFCGCDTERFGGHVDDCVPALIDAALGKP